MSFKNGLFETIKRSTIYRRHTMTMPDERARALRFAGQVLREMLTREDVPEDLKHQARVTLRHYPTEAQLKQMTEDFSEPIVELRQIWLA